MRRTTLPLPCKRLLTADEAASYCGVSVSTLRAHVRVDPLKIGNCTRYDVKDLDRWLDSRRESVPETADDWLRLLDEN